MKKTSKKFFAGLLAVLMLLTVMPANVVLAEEQQVMTEDVIMEKAAGPERTESSESIETGKSNANEQSETETGEVENVPVLMGQESPSRTQENLLQESLSLGSTVQGTVLAAGDEITAGGTYYVDDTTTGTITISTTEAVIIQGSGVTWDSAGNITSKKTTGIHLNYSVPGANLTLQDCYLENIAADDSAPLIDFLSGKSSETNSLTIKGIVLLEKTGAGQGTYSMVHVAHGNNLTVKGEGTLYAYKASGGSGLGGNKNEMNGDITFDLTGKIFAKGSKQGALIGAGTGASSSTDVPGFVKFKSGEFNFISNSRGAAIGGSAGSTGGSTGTRVYVEKNANININVDYSGAAVGGGGYDGGNDASGGILYVDGGNLRTYVDKNVAKNTTGYQGKTIAEGINDAAITAQRLNSNEKEVYCFAFDTALLKTGATDFTVKVDGSSDIFYQGGLSKYGYVQEGLDKGEQLTITSTISNWYLNGETALYFYLTGQNHTIDVNGETFNLVWNAGKQDFQVVPEGYKPVYFYCNQSEAEGFELTVSDYVSEFPTASFETEGRKGYVVYLAPAGLVIEGKASKGAYTYTAKANGYYGSTCGFTLNADGTIKYTTSWSESIQTQYGIKDTIDGANATFNLDLETFTKSPNPGAWDGTTLDVTWFTPGQSDYYISTPAQLAGLAAIVNGIYNDEITVIIDNVEGTVKNYTPREYAKLPDAKIVAGCSAGNNSGPNGMNQVTSSDYYYNAKGYDFFLDETKTCQRVHLTADLDMGGYQTESGWTGARYMPIGGQYQMYFVKKGIADGYSHLGSSFNGYFDGQGHIVSNVYCDRYSITAYGDSSTIGLFGRVGIADSDYSNWKTKGNDGGNYPPTNPTIKGVAVTGYIYGRRSVGGIVGKTGHTSKVDLNDGTMGVIVDSCLNFAEVHNTDAKGVGGIIGAAWNGGITRNCGNYGYVHSSYNDPTGGIIGYNENSIENCLNVGLVKNFANDATKAEAIGSHNGGSYFLRNNYWLTGSAAAGGYYNPPTAYKDQIVEKTAAELKAATFAATLSGTSRAWTFPAGTEAICDVLTATENVGYPVPRVFTSDTAAVSSLEKKADPINHYNIETKVYDYTEGQVFDPTGLQIWINWNDETKSLVDNEDLTVTLDGEPSSLKTALTLGDHTIKLSYAAGDKSIEASYGLHVVASTIGQVTVMTQPTQKSYNENDAFNPTGMKLKFTYTNGSTVTAIYNAETNYFVDTSDATIVYDVVLHAYTNEEKTMECPINALSAAFDGNGITAVYTYTDGSQASGDTSAITVIGGADKPAKDGGYYLIANAGNLKWFALQVNNGIEPAAKAKLTADITCGEEFERIGTSTTGKRFTGEFDGQGHVVTYKASVTVTYYGLFGYVDGGSIKNVTVKGSLSCVSYGAGLAGYLNNATVENCISKVNVSSTAAGYNGGITSFATGTTTIKQCGNRGEIKTSNTTSNTKIGGIAGSVEAASVVITNCYNRGNIEGHAASSSYGVGGVVGYLKAKASISNVYNIGTIKQTGTVTATTNYSGSVIGQVTSVNSALVSNYYWLEKTSAYALGYGTKLDTNKMTAVQMKSQEVLAALGAAYIAGCDGYPALSFEPGEHVDGNKDGKCDNCSTEIIFKVKVKVVKPDQTETTKEVTLNAIAKEGQLLYSGTNKKPDPRCIAATTRYAELADILSEAGISYEKEWTVKVTDGKKTSAELTIGQLLANRYYSPEWAGASEYTNEISGENAVKVPAVLALDGYQVTVSSPDYALALSDGAAFAAKADYGTAPRFFYGQDISAPANDSTSGNYPNIGANSISNVTEIVVTEKAEAHVAYTTHVQNIGWQDYVSDGAMAGTSGKALHLEGLKVKLSNIGVDGSIEYRTHVENIGWQEYVADNAMAGTSGRNLQLEAVQVRLKGEAAELYDVYYRVHAANFGWMGWAKNDALAGTAGYAYSLEAIEIKLVEKGGKAPGSTANAFNQKGVGSRDGDPDKFSVLYTTHVENIGWQNYVSDGNMAGTSGRALRLEGIKIKLKNAPYDGSIDYSTHVENIGWQDFVKDDEMAGTSGRRLRLEAIKIKLTGEIAEYYDVYYRVHAENFGWLGWAKNGVEAGTAGYAYRLEGINIVLVEKGAAAPGSTAKAFCDKKTGYYDGDPTKFKISYTTHVENIGWQDYVSDGEMAGTSGKALRLESIKILMKNAPYTGSVEYRTHIQDIGWESEFKKDGEMSGTSGKAKRLEAIEIKLTGEMAEHYDIYYRVHAQKFGWLGWAKNGAQAGTAGYAYRLEAIEIVLVEKGGAAPGSTKDPFHSKY